MLYVKSNLSNTNWLQYLMEEFCRIEKAKFKFQITASNIDTGDSPFININRDRLSQNAFYLTFLTLSRKEEYISEIGGKAIQSYSYNHPDKNRNWKIPVVTEFFKNLKSELKSTYPSLEFEQEDTAILELSHDLDYIKKTTPLRLKQSAFNLFNGFKHGSLKKLSKAAEFLFLNTNYWCFDYWLDFEKQVDFKSIFYVYSKADSANIKQWLLDPSYNVSEDKALQHQLKKMLKQGWEIGLHGSFFSSDSLKQLSFEKQKLEQALGHEVTKTRQHWLRYKEDATPFIHEKLFEQDSSVAWNNEIGFRAGIASKYRPYNHKEDRPFNYFIVPQIIMDSNIYDYGFGKEKNILKDSLDLLNTCKNTGNTHVSISWHPRTCSKDYNWHYGYEKLVKIW